MQTNKRFHFISGLPRSGSTLLSAILRQNPAVMAGMTSPVGSMTATLRNLMVQNREVDSLIDDADRIRILRGIFDSYYAGFPDKDLILDTNRAWTVRIPELMQLFDDFKMIAMVRNPAWIMDSTERMLQKNAVRPSALAAAGSNLNQRVTQYMSDGGFIGAPMANLKEAMYGPHAKRVMIVEYEALCAEPEKVMDAIYTFLGEEPFKHSFDNLDYKQERFDEALNTEGLHTVSGPVQIKERKTLLPPDMFLNLAQKKFWDDQQASTAATRIIT